MNELLNWQDSVPVLELYPFLRFSWIWLYFITVPELIEIYCASVIKFTSNESTKSKTRVVKGPFDRWFYFSSIIKCYSYKNNTEEGENVSKMSKNSDSINRVTLTSYQKAALSTHFLCEWFDLQIILNLANIPIPSCCYNYEWKHEKGMIRYTWKL